MKLHAVKIDGRTVYVTVPPLDCRGCSGDGRRWDDACARYVDKPCPECQGSGDVPEEPAEKPRPSAAFEKRALHVARSVGRSYGAGGWEVDRSDRSERAANLIVKILEGVFKGEAPRGAYEAYLLGFRCSDATDMMLHLLQAAEAIAAGDFPDAEKHIEKAAEMGRVDDVARRR